MVITTRMTAAIAIAAALALAAAGTAAAKVEGDTIVLGAALSLTGKYSTNGKHVKNGYDLAVKLINDRGGVKVGAKRYKISVRYYDDESTSVRGAQLAERLIKQDGVKFMLGPYSSGLTKAVAPITEKHKIPMVQGNGASRGLFNKGYKYMFAVLSTSELYLSSVIGLAAEQAKRDGRDPSKLRIAIVVENDPFSLDVRAGVLDDAKRRGMKVVIDERMPRDFSDLTPALTKIKALKPDVFAASGHSKGAALVIRQAAQQRVNAPIMAVTHCESGKVNDKAKFGNAAEGVLCPAQWVPELTYKDKWFGLASQYASIFKAAYGYVPPYQAAESTAAVLVWVDALERAGAFGVDKVRAALVATDLQTFFGYVKFDGTGKNTRKPMVLRQIQNGEFKLVAPAKWATSKLVFPRALPK